MASYLKASIERSYAESFLAELERNENQYFFFIGKGTTWANENSPSAYTDSVAAEYQVMSDIIGYKKLNPENIIFALPRYEWESGTVYDQYDDNIDLFDETDPALFYVVTDENNIYKCLSNGNGAESTEKPSQVLTTPFGTADGYRWQYLATVKESDLPYELTDYIPVDFATVSSDTETQNQYNTQAEAVNSSVTRMVVSNSSGASAGVYPNAISKSVEPFSTVYTLNVTGYSETDGVKKITIADEASRSRIANVSSINDYIGYMVRVDSSTVNSAQINNYAVITNVLAGTNEYVFTVEDDEIDFTIDPSGNGDFASIEIVPYIRITGNGSGAYAYPVMTTDRTISSVEVVNGGSNYSKILAEVTSPKTAVTVHPSLRVVLSPKGGHGSNILKELNVKDILIIVEVSETDAENIVGGGSYRQFGIIKNPLLGDGTGVVAGKENLYYRDITLIPVGTAVDQSIFDLSAANLIIGKESYSAAKVSGVKATSTTNNTITLKTLNTSGRFITKQDRNNDYVLTMNADLSPNFLQNEIVSQTIPAGTVLGSGISYGYDLISSAKVLTVSGRTLDVRLTTDNSFVSGYSVVGSDSAATGTVSSVTPRYGESVWVTNTDGLGAAQFVADSANNQTLYKVVETSQAYFDLDQTPSYRGLHVLHISTSVSAATGAIDTTYSTLTQNSYSNGDVIEQGVTAQFGHYARGVVYDWEFVNSSYGKLYLSDVLGEFKSVQTDGLTGTQLGGHIVASVDLPDIDRTSGEVLYIDNVRPIQRTRAQEEEFRLRLGF
jgi:hypothetical protein